MTRYPKLESPSPKTRRAMLAGTASGLLLLVLGGCGAREKAATPAPLDVVAPFHPGGLPRTDPADPAWRSAPEHTASLLVQDQVDPKLSEPSIALLKARALNDGSWIVFRLEWEDPTRDDVAATAHPSDAVAVQFPVEAGGDVPDAAMGQAGRPVRISLWRAAWERRLASPDDPVRVLYPNAPAYHYPYEHAPADAREPLQRLYAPARGAGNPVTLGRADSSTQDLVAEGFGTLTEVPEQVSLGKGSYAGGRWTVTLARPLDPTAQGALRPGARTYAAFAVWDGGSRNVGARKMRTGWIPLRVEAAHER